MPGIDASAAASLCVGGLLIFFIQHICRLTDDCLVDECVPAINNRLGYGAAHVIGRVIL